MLNKSTGVPLPKQMFKLDRNPYAQGPQFFIRAPGTADRDPQMTFDPLKWGTSQGPISIRHGPLNPEIMGIKGKQKFGWTLLRHEYALPWSLGYA